MDETPETSTTRRVLIAVAVLGMPAWVFLAVMALKQFGVIPSKQPSPAVALPPAGVELSTVAGVSLRRLSRNPSGSSRGSSSGGGHFLLEGSAMDLKDIVRSVVPGRLDGEEFLPGGSYAFKIEVTTGGQAEAAQRLGQVLEEGLGLRMVREKRESSVLALTCPDHSAFAMTSIPLAHRVGVTNRGRDGGDRTASFTGNMTALVRFVEEELAGQPVVDGTGIRGPHEAHLRWRSGDRRSLEKMLDGYGLKLEPKRQEVEATFIEKVGDEAEAVVDPAP
ncbi:MAG: TIGR03435 family protein [Phycisphaerae bacterium]|nr:TIGR03435 family protein [Phycisphaerae bacterium]